MKLIYFAHPYGGDEINKKKASDLMGKLQECYPELCFVSPIHGLHTGIDYMSYTTELAMEHCITLLSKCDELWTVPEWETSPGCKEEVEFCRQNSKKFRIIDCNLMSQEINNVKKTLSLLCEIYRMHDSSLVAMELYPSLNIVKIRYLNGRFKVVHLEMGSNSDIVLKVAKVM